MKSGARQATARRPRSSSPAHAAATYPAFPAFEAAREKGPHARGRDRCRTRTAGISSDRLDRSAKLVLARCRRLFTVPD